MPRPLGQLRVLLSSRILFDLEEADNVFKTKGVEAYTDYMLCQGAYENDKDPQLGCRRLKKGPLFDFALAMNRLNALSKKDPIVEIGMTCKDETDTALALFRNLNDSELGLIEYRIMTAGKPISAEIHRAFKTDFFLTRSEADAQIAIDMDIASAVVNFPPKGTYDYPHDAFPIRMIHDGDAVTFGGSAEVRFREAIDAALEQGKTYEEGLANYKKAEKRDVNEPVEAGPFTLFLAKLTQLNSQFERDKVPFENSLLTARGGPASDRALSTALKYKIQFNGVSGFMGGASKHELLEQLKPHLFFDDQQTHLEKSAEFCPTGRVPYKTGSPMYEYLLRKKREAEVKAAASASPVNAAFSGATDPGANAVITAGTPQDAQNAVIPQSPRPQ